MADVNSRFAIVTKEEILHLFLFLECGMMLSPSLYMRIQLFSSISVNSLEYSAGFR